MVIVCTIITNTQVAIGNDQLHYEGIPTSIAGCTNETIFAAKLVKGNDIPQSNDGFAFYKISFMWYGPIGALITWISCIIISYLTGGQDLNEMNLNLLAPCIKNLLPKKYRHTQLQLLTDKPVDGTADGDENKDNLNTTEWVWKNDDKNQIE